MAKFGKYPSIDWSGVNERAVHFYLFRTNLIRATWKKYLAHVVFGDRRFI